MLLKTYIVCCFFFFLSNLVMFKDLSVKTTSQKDGIWILKFNIVSVWRAISGWIVAPFIFHSRQNCILRLHFASVSAWEYDYY